MVLQQRLGEGMMRIGDVVLVDVSLPDGGVVQFYSRIIWQDGCRIGVTLPHHAAIKRDLGSGTMVMVSLADRNSRLTRPMRVAGQTEDMTPLLVLDDVCAGMRPRTPRRLWQAASSGRMPFGWGTGS